MPCRWFICCTVAVQTAGITPATAQPPQDASSPTSIATLAIWADRVWLSLADRDGAYAGRLSEAGTFQRFHPLMDSEYGLDLATGLFSPAEDARWTPVGRGLRVAGASINHPFILNDVEWRERVGIAGPVTLPVRYVRERSLTAQRDYLTVGVAWRGVLGSPWTVFTSLGVHFFKPSSDVELGARGAFAVGRDSVAVRVRVAALDAFNDLIFNTLGVGAEETEAHFDYTTHPFAARTTIGWSGPWGHAELAAGASTRSRVRVTFPAAGDTGFTLAEQMGFAGALVEVRPVDVVALAAYATVAHAATDRSDPVTDAAIRGQRERTEQVGLRARAGMPAGLGLELDLWSRWRPETRTDGTNATLDHDDREVFVQGALVREPVSGWLWRVSVSVMDRDAGVLAPFLTATHGRLVWDAGYRFPSRFEVRGGVRWDLDAGTAGPFDGGHLRLAAVW